MIETGVETPYAVRMADANDDIITGPTHTVTGTFIITDGVLSLSLDDRALAGFAGASALLVAGLAATIF